MAKKLKQTERFEKEGITKVLFTEALEEEPEECDTETLRYERRQRTERIQKKSSQLVLSESSDTNDDKAS